MQAGADAHISKPVTPDRLLSAIDELLNGAAPDLF
jgi:DNA-binding NarL/FixJ family response regulator